MATAVHTGSSLVRSRAAVRRLRNAVSAALPVLAELERLEQVPDRIGTFALEDQEPLNEEAALEFLRLARAQHQGELEIIVIGHTRPETGGSNGRQGIQR